MRTVQRCKIYDLSSELTTKIRRKLTFIYKHEDDENFDEIYHWDKLFGMVDDWAEENGMTPDHEREPRFEAFYDKFIIESDSGRLGYLSIFGGPGAWEAVVQYPKEGESIFGMEEVILK